MEPKQRQQVWEDVIGVIDVIDGIKRKSHNDLERETAYADVYVNCYPFSSWENLAKKLYRRQQVAAVEEVKSYLPPRGEPYICSACNYCTSAYGSRRKASREVGEM